MKFASSTINAGTNAKTVKGDHEYLTAIMYLSPYKTLEGFNACAMAEMAKCFEPCLNTAGRGGMIRVQDARLRKTMRFVDNREHFMRDLDADIYKFVKFCKRQGVKPAIRLNGTSDIRWELIKVGGKTVFEHYPDVQFYDYTKIANRRIPDHINNYHLTWSYSNANPKYEQMYKTALDNSMNIAVVFRDKKQIPDKFLGLSVIDGDTDDLRFLDPPASVVALYAKGKAKHDNSGFVID